MCTSLHKVILHFKDFIVCHINYRQENAVKLIKQMIGLVVISNVAGPLNLIAAPGFTALPTTTPFPHPTIIGASTAYVPCNNIGGIKNPTTSPANECFLSPNPPSDLSSPLPGYGLVVTASRPVTLNNVYSGNTNKNIGTLLDVVWRKPAATEPLTATPMCIYGTKFTATSTDYNVAAVGNQYFEANGIARGGFVETANNIARDIEIAYGRMNVSTEVLYRAGRSFTSVQYRLGGQYIPQTGLGSSPSINGLNSWSGSPSSIQQKADVNNNWVEFTTDISSRDDDGSFTPTSGMLYIRTTCSTEAPVAVEGAIRLRQTFQNQSTDGFNPSADQRFIEVSLRGFVPPNGLANPAPINPFQMFSEVAVHL